MVAWKERFARFYVIWENLFRESFKVGCESNVSELGVRKRCVCARACARQLSEVGKLSPTTSEASAMPLRLSLPFGWSCNIKFQTPLLCGANLACGCVRASTCTRACVWRLICGGLCVCACVCVSASLSLCVSSAQVFDVWIVPEVKQDVCHLSPESDTVNLAVSPQTTISGVKGYEEGTYRLITSFNLYFRLVTRFPLSWCDRRRRTGHTFLKFCDKVSKRLHQGVLNQPDLHVSRAPKFVKLGVAKLLMASRRLRPAPLT